MTLALWSADTQQALFSWLATYAVHSTLLIGAAWLLIGRGRPVSLKRREMMWKTVLVGGVLTASLQSAWNINPLGGLWNLAADEQVGAGGEILVNVDGALADGTRGRSHDTSDGLSRITVLRDGSTIAEAEAPVPQAASDLYATSGTNGTGANLTLDPAQHGPHAGELGGDEGPIAARLATVEPVRLASAGTVNWTPWILLLWASVAAILLGNLVRAWLALSRTLACRRPISGGSLHAKLEHLRKQGGLRRPVRLCVSQEIASPLAMGTFRPEICLPERVEQLPEAMQESILAHELAHVARFDPLWLVLARALEVALFFQPLNRIARKQLLQTTELLCDDWAVERTQEPIELARSLAEVAGWLIGESPQPACGMVAHDTGGSALGARVSRLVTRRTHEAGTRWLLPLGAGVLGATTLLAPGFASAALDRSPEPELKPVEVTPRPEVEIATDASFSVEPDIEFAPEEWIPQPETAESPIQVMEALAAELGRELETLDESLTRLKTRIHDGEAPATVRGKLESLEERAAALLGRQARMNELMSLLRSSRTATAMQQSTETPQ